MKKLLWMYAGLMVKRNRYFEDKVVREKVIINEVRKLKNGGSTRINGIIEMIENGSTKVV